MATKPRIYLDSCCVIEIAKGADNPGSHDGRADDVWMTRMLLKAARAGEIDVFMSTLAIAECRHAGYGNNVPEEVKRVFRVVLESGYVVKLVEPDYFIMQQARDLSWEHGINLRSPDPIHIASAIDMKCAEYLTYEFKTKLLEAKGKIEKLGVRVLRPSQTLLLPDHYRQETLDDEFEKAVEER